MVILVGNNIAFILLYAVIVKVKWKDFDKHFY